MTRTITKIRMIMRKTTMTDPYDPISVGDLADLVYDAYELIQSSSGQHNEIGVTEANVQSWLLRYRYLQETLSGNRHALRAKVFESLGTASMCWEWPSLAGTFLSDEAGKIGDDLMSFIDKYMDALPLFRNVSAVQFDESDPAEGLAKAIYEISAKVAANADKWAEAPDGIKRVLRETAQQLIGSGIIEQAEKLEHPLRTIEASPDEMPPGMREQAEQAIAEMLGQGQEPDAAQRPYCLSGCDRLDYHDGRDPGACMTNGRSLMPLPTPIRMPPGFRSDSDRSDDG